MQSALDDLSLTREDMAALVSLREARIAELERIIRAILDGDEHGQGVLWQEAMDAAHKTINAK